MKIKQKIKKLSLKITGILASLVIFFNNIAYADVVQEVSGGGEIQNSKLGQGLFNMIKDATGFFQWIIPVAGVCVCLYCLLKILTGDEQDQARYKKAIMKVLICIIAGLVAVTIVNLIAKYFV